VSDLSYFRKWFGDEGAPRKKTKEQGRLGLPSQQMKKRELQLYSLPRWSVTLLAKKTRGFCSLVVYKIKIKRAAKNPHKYDNK
jgi:hypothetical protein